MARHNARAPDMEAEVLTFSRFGRAVNGAKIMKDYLRLKNLPDECEMFGPDMTVQNTIAKTFYT
jgi:hypothetical protein